MKGEAVLDPAAGVTATAMLSPDGRHRYLLRRQINPTLVQPLDVVDAVLKGCPIAKRVLFVMLNPSTADATKDDNTIRRCKSFAAEWGASVLTVVNLFSFRATKPAELLGVRDPSDKTNEEVVREEIAAHKDGIIVAAWGRFAKLDNCDRTWIKVAVRMHDGWCLGANQDGSPRHPLYVPAVQKLIPYGRD